MELALGFVVGLVVGWFFLPTPQWAKDIYAKIFGGSE